MKAAGRIALVVVALAAATAIMLAFRDHLDKVHVALVYLLVVFAGSTAVGRRTGLALSGIAFLAFNFLFLPPYYTLTVTNPLDWLVLVAFLITGIVVAELVNRLRRQADIARQRTAELDRLSTLGAETLNAARAEQALVAIARVIASALGVERCELFVREDNGLRAVTDPAGNPDASSLVEYVVRHGHSAVEHEDRTLRVIDADVPESLQSVRALAVPLVVRGESVGALRVSSASTFSVGEEQRRVLDALSYYAALGIARLSLERAEEVADALRRSDRQKDALLAAVSHDLRTPLTTIKAVANEIVRGAPRERAAEIERDTDRLTMLVDDLLQLSRLEAGALPANMEVNTVDDLIGAALARSRSTVGAHPVEVRFDGDDLIAGRFDFSQTLRILTNLIDNAAKYSTPESPIVVRVRRDGDMIAIEVVDQGVGVPPAERELIFQPFYRSPGATPDVRGAGLGLAIARRLAEAQEGRLELVPHQGPGSTFRLTVPAIVVAEA